MKISQEEIDAANYALGELMEAPLDEAVMEHALIAALKARRARKQAKRERQRKEKDKQVVESVKPVTNMAQSESDDAQELLNYYRQNLGGLRGTGRPKGEQ